MARIRLELQKLYDDLNKAEEELKNVMQEAIDNRIAMIEVVPGRDNLHLRRFFGLKGEKAAYFFMLCFIISLLCIFITPLIDSSIHSSYFK